MRKIIVVDDDAGIRSLLTRHLEFQGYSVATHAHLAPLRQLLKGDPFDAVVLDIRLENESGLDAIAEIKNAWPHTPIIMISAFHDMTSTIAAMKLGATEYIRKPLNLDDLDNAFSNCWQHVDEQNNALHFPYDEFPKYHLAGSSKVMYDLYKAVGRIAGTPATVLILGESGSGKELIARAIHNAGDNSEGPFVAVNCAALVDSLLESEMFGHNKGAYTGAVSDHIGKFQLAQNGTLFLDEIGELKPDVQAKLLRVLQEREFSPLGSTKVINTNARVITATNCDLTKMVEQKQFREDLYYRLNVVNLKIPSLRDRTEDIVELVGVLLNRANRLMNKQVQYVANDVIEAFHCYDWLGNVRELSNLLERVVTLSHGNIISRELIPEYILNQNSGFHNKHAPQNSKLKSSQSLRDIEEEQVRLVLIETNWHKGKACEILGVSRPRLQRLIQQYQIDEFSLEAEL